MRVALLAAALAGAAPPAADLTDASIARLHALYRAHRLTVTQVVRWHLVRLHRYNGVYRAVQTPLDAEALRVAAAEDADSRRPGFVPGPLWGVPIVVKANMSIAGEVTTAGWRGFDRPGHRLIAPRDATVVARLKAAALPYRRSAAGGIEVLLVTSRTRRRWILPKGKVAAGMPPHRSAAREAMEEAGVIGVPDDRPIGEYSATKRQSPEYPNEVRVQVFALMVTSELLRWPEDQHRERRWLSPDKAAALIDDPGIRAVLQSFASDKV